MGCEKNARVEGKEKEELGGKKKKPRVRVMPAAVRKYVEAAPLEALKNIVESAPLETLEELKNFVEMQVKKRKVMADMVRQAKEVGLTAADIVTLLGQ
jgi:predicted RNA-binding protein